MKKKVYAALELADGEVRLAVMELYEGRANVLRVEKQACEGAGAGKILDESSVVSAIRKVLNNAQAALGYRIERVLLLIPSVNVQRSSQKIRVAIEDGTRTVRLFHVQQGLSRAAAKKLDDQSEYVNANKITYTVNGNTSAKIPLSEECDAFTMNVELLHADKQTLYAYARAAEQANLEILDVVLDSYAAGQEDAALAQSEDRPIVQVSLEAGHTLLSFFSKGQLMSCFDLDKGFDWFIQPLADEYHLSKETAFRLLLNCFSSAMTENGESIVYIEQQEERRVQITAGQLAKTVIPRIREWIATINEACGPIVQQGKAKYILTGKGAGIPVLEELLKGFNAPAVIYASTNVGARDSSFVNVLGAAYVWNEAERIKHDGRISANNNELEASIDQIKTKTRSGDGGFTRRMKSAVLSDKG